MFGRPEVGVPSVAYREDRPLPEGSKVETPARAEARPETVGEGLRRETRPDGVEPAGPAEPPTSADPADDATAAAPNGKPKSRRRLFALAALALALIGGGYYGWRYWTEGRFLVSTDDAYVAGDITILAAKVPGYVKSVDVQNDQFVKAGEVIFRIDDGDYKLAVQSAKDKVATLEATVARIDRQVAAAKAQVMQAEPQILASRADRVRADLEFERQTKLSQADFASKAKFEQARADRDKTVAAVQTAEAALTVAKSNVEVLQSQVVEASRNADEARTQLARAERDLAFTEVRAPVSGTVGNRAVQVGSYVQPGTRLAALVPLDTVHVDANYKETQLSPIKPGQIVRLEVDAYPGREIPATVESIAPASGSQYSLLPPENATGNFTKIVQRVPVRVKVDPKVAAEGLLRPGMSVVVRTDIRDPQTARAALAKAPDRNHEAR